VGNAVIFGHVDEFGAPFRHLDRLKPGDAVVLEAAGRRFDYTVRRVWAVDPADVAVVAPIPGVRDLTLFTCTGAANTRRLIVRAALRTSSAASAVARGASPVVAAASPGGEAAPGSAPPGSTAAAGSAPPGSTAPPGSAAAPGAPAGPR
jgi:hypothetical protein